MKINRLKKCLPHGAAILMLWGPLYAVAPTRPNILLINVDDLGYMDTELYGNHDFSTPNILRLAGMGMRFTHAYAAASNCAPSRASLLSGQYGPRHGIYTVGSSERGKSRDRRIIPEPNREVLADSVITLAEKLHEGGYATFIVGKWHLGEDPLTQGFEINVGGTAKGSPASHFSPYKNPRLADGPEGEYLADRLTDEAIALLEKAGERPFFLYLPYYAVHSPLQGKKDLVQKYLSKGFPDETARYAAMVENVDSNIGRLIGRMEELGLFRNTLVVFTSDNGGISHLHFQHPLRAGKGSYYEGGTRVPLVMVKQGYIRAGTTSDFPVSHIDFYPTFLSIAGIAPGSSRFDGVDLSPVLRGKKGRPRLLYWHFPVYLESYRGARDEARDTLFRTRPGTTLRSGKWKLHHYFEMNEFELYDLDSDPGERHNLLTEKPRVAGRLKREMFLWRTKVNAPVPDRPNPDYGR